jgi:4-hydroxy-tetrahydrodipicolinate reductase
MNINETNIAVFGKGKTGSKVIELIEGNYSFRPIVFDSTNLPDKNKLKNISFIIAFVPSEILNKYIDLFLQQGISLVSGATGLCWSNEVKEKIVQNKLHWITGSNFSLGMRVIYQMIKVLEKAKKIWPSVNLNIHEIHHTKKVDGPSGTALSWGEWIGIDDKSKITFNREGDVVGDHSLEFETKSEKITLRHEALDRTLFAEGAIFALEYLIQGKLNPGLHYFEDITKKELN